MRTCYALCTALVVSIIGVGLSRLIFPYDLGRYEAGVWAPAHLAYGGQNPYDLRHSLKPPYTMAPHGALYYFIIGAGLDWFGPQFLSGRGVSLGAAAVIACALAVIARRLTGSSSLGLLAAVTFLSLAPVQFWLAVQKPDFSALALAAGAFSLVMCRTSRTATGLGPVAAGLLLAGAFFFRQTLILPAFVVAGWYVAGQCYRAAALVLLMFTAAVATVVIWLDLGSSGGYVWQSFLMAAAVPKSVGNVTRHVTTLLTAPATLAVGAVSLWLTARALPFARTSSRTWPETGAGWENRGLGRFFSVLVAYLLGSIAIALVTCSRDGASLNYWLEPCVAVSLLLPTAWVRVRAVNPDLANRWLPRVLAIISVCGLVTAARVCRGEYFRWDSLDYFDELVVATAYEAGDGPCFSVYPEMAVAAGRAYVFNDFCQYDGRAAQQQAVFTQAFRDHVFSAVIWHSPDPPDGYRHVPLSTPAPTKVVPVYLHVRR